MNLILTVDEKSFTPCPAGHFKAMCVKAVDLGLQETHFGEKHQVYLQFETDQLQQDGTPYSIGTTVTASLNAKATLRKLLQGWRGKPFASGEAVDLTQLLKKALGKPAKVMVEHEYGQNGETYAKLRSLQPSNEAFQIQADCIGNANYLEGPDWLQEKVAKGHQRMKKEAQAVQQGHDEVMDDEVPF